VLKPRKFDHAQPRSNTFINNTCYLQSGSPASRCVIVKEGAVVDGLVLRNLLFFAGGAQAGLLEHGGSGSVDQAGNRVVTTNPFRVAQPVNRADFALVSSSDLIDQGVVGRSRGVDLLSQPSPLGARPDVGAVEGGGSGSPTVDLPPAAPLLLSVDVQ
jgi:hypothetical protein